MSKQKQSVLHIQYKVLDSKDEWGNPYKRLHALDSAKHDAFLNALEQGQIVDAFYDANKDDGTLAQLAKVHACIRQLAIDTGDNFEDLKFEVKKMAGLCVAKDINGEKFLVCKSLSKCSKEELGLVIETIIQIGDTVGINFR
jgi:hypothetical protein